MQLRRFNSSSRQAVQPAGFKNIKLYPHQLTLLHYCHKLEVNRCIKKEYTSPTEDWHSTYVDYINEHKIIINTDFGVICDKVGSGK